MVYSPSRSIVSSGHHFGEGSRCQVPAADSSYLGNISNINYETKNQYKCCFFKTVFLFSFVLFWIYVFKKQHLYWFLVVRVFFIPRNGQQSPDDSQQWPPSWWREQISIKRQLWDHKLRERRDLLWGYSSLIIIEICKAPTLWLKALNKHTHIMYIKMENVIKKKKMYILTSVHA